MCRYYNCYVGFLCYPSDQQLYVNCYATLLTTTTQIMAPFLMSLHCFLLDSSGQQIEDHHIISVLSFEISSFFILLQGHLHIPILALDGLMSKMLPWPISLHTRFPQQMEGIAWWKELFTTQNQSTSSARCILPFVFRKSKFIYYFNHYLMPLIHKCNAIQCILVCLEQATLSCVFTSLNNFRDKCFPMTSDCRDMIKALSLCQCVTG